MKEIGYAKEYFYAVDTDDCNWVEIEITFTRELQKPALEKAINDTLVRYPYIAKKLAIVDERYVLVENDTPAQVFDLKDKPYYLMGPKNNDAMFRFAVDGCILSARFFHGLCDARGFDTFLKSVLYEYFNRTEKRIHIVKGVNTLDSPIDSEESADPLEGIVLPPPSEEQAQVPVMAYQLPESTNAQGHRFSYLIEANQNAVMDAVRQLKSSPNAFATLLMTNAILAIRPEASGRITTGIAMDLRSTLNVTKSLHNCTVLLSLPHQKAMETMDLPTQGACYREMISRQAQKDERLRALSYIEQFRAYIAEVPTLKGRRALTTSIISSFYEADTFQVSYMGPQDYGQLEEYICSLYLSVDMKHLKLFIEISCIKNKFFFNIMQSFEDDGYVTSFISQLKAVGVEVICKPPRRLESMITDCRLE